jgi:hypothetical protein
MRKTRWTYAMATALALVAVAVTGCSSGTSKTLSRSAFISQADSICTATNVAIGHLAQPSTSATPAQVVSFTQQVLTIVPPALTRLTRLKSAPADVAVLTQNLLVPARALVLAEQMLIDNVQEANGNAATAEAALEYFTGSSTNPNQGSENQALSTFGFRACDHLGQPSASPTTATTAPPSTAVAPSGVTPTTIAGGSAKAFVAADAGFSAVFPVTPTRVVSPLENDVTLQKVLYDATTATEDVSVLYALHPVAPTAAEVQQVLAENVNLAAAGIDGVVTSMSPLTYLGSPAEDAVITTPDQIDRLRVVIIGAKFYAIQGFTPVTATAHPEYDELLATFHTA